MKYSKDKDGSTVHCYDPTTGELITTTGHGEAVYHFKSDDEKAEMLMAISNANTQQITEGEYNQMRNAMNSKRRVGDVLEMRKAAE